MKYKKKIIIAIVVLFVILGYIFRYEIQDEIACLAYYDQCRAERVYGLTKDECFERDNTVAYLLDGGVCLVRSE